MRILVIKWVILPLLLSNSCAYTAAFTIQDLGGTWRVTNAEKDYDLSATVPGGIYSDLMQNNIIGDVFYGFNDIETRWVSKLDWNYSRSFAVEGDLLAHDNINLVFNGVDTFSKILINDAEIGITENMFVKYIFDVKPHLQLGKNHIVIQFKSPVDVAKSLFAKQAESYIVPPKCVPNKYNGECHVNHIRKMQASFAWDWGPAFPSVGVWKKVYLEAYNSSLIRDITINTSLNATTNSWDFQLKTYFAENSKSGFIQGTLLVEMPTDKENVTKMYNINIKRNEDGDFLTIQSFAIPKSYIQLWWPNGYGKAKLYDVKVSFVSLNKTEKSTKIFKIGFRTVELVQDVIGDKYKENGRTFYFKINNIPIFAKGSNSIPINILPELGQNETTVRFLLQSAKDVHMNMLRVWGGGTYESDLFYELADEMGILIWQDFMFACSMYPTNDNFIRTVVSEVKHQVRRLQYHPSIILWAGNNENEVALRLNWYGTFWHFGRYKADYIKLYIDTIKKEVLLNDNTRPYLTSSPTNGIKSEQEGHVAINPKSDKYGDVHFYMYIRDSWDRTIYPISRFASEYGYQSMPSIDTLLTATNDTKDLNTDSPFLTSRQHHMMGYSKMRHLISYELQLPRQSEHYYKAFIFYSQIIQAMAIKTETEYYRQWRSHINNSGKGFTMGALYWQLNDVWAAPSWAGIDFKNNWKMLHYYAKNFFAPIIITGDLDSRRNNLDIYVVSDLMETISNAVVTVSVFRWDSFTSVKEDTINIDVLPAASHNIKTYTVEKYLSPCGKDAKKNCFIYFTLKNSNNQSIAPDNYAFPGKLRWANLQKPILKISTIQQIDNSTEQFIIEVKTNAIALFVWLDVKGIRGRFSDNGFLQVTAIKYVYFYADQPTTVSDIQRFLRVTNLLDNQYTD